MTFKELRQLFIGDYTFVKVYEEDSDNLLTQYNGRDNLVDDYDDCNVTGITGVGTYDYDYASGRHLSYVKVELNAQDVDRVKERAKYNERDQIIFGEDFNPAKYMGGIRRFCGLTKSKLQDLVDKGFIDLNGQQNMSPTVEEFQQFTLYIRDPENWSFGGYAVTPDRTDCRVTIDELICEDTMIVMPEDASLFVHFARHADDMDFYYDPNHPENNELRALWY